MLVSGDILEQAMARVFEGQVAGEGMTLGQITTAWEKIALRRSDLSDAIREMMDTHCLVANN